MPARKLVQWPTVRASGADKGSVLVGNEHVPPLIGLTLVDKGRGAASLLDLEPGSKPLQTAHTRPALAPDVHPLTGANDSLLAHPHT